MASSDRDVLPKSVKPSHYEISIFNVESGGSWGYQGVVKIHVDIKEEVKEITLNTLQLTIQAASIAANHAKTEQTIKASDISYNEKSHRATLTFPTEIPQSEHAVLEIHFSGTVNNIMAGFYRSKYKPVVPAAKSVPRDEEYHYMFSTQFESCDARRAFPCFDEPNLKATFDFEIEIPEDQVALSNMPEKETRKVKNNMKVVSFDTTPIMSTYLLAWAFGDFEYVEDFTRRKYNGAPLPVRVYTTKGLKEQGRYALEHAHQVVDLFSELFQIDYPLPKADLLAVHEFSHGAMENWGLVTYRTTAVLFDEENSDQRFRNRVAYVVAHELAHQWFGNLVTMDWWIDLWLNEGFATFIGWYAIDKLHPDWNVWGQFVSEGSQGAFKLDSLRTSHAIEVPVRDALEVDQIFDAISYLKGSSVIRMLSSHLGIDTFLQGVSNYLKAHSYGNATTDDLWSALTEASGQNINDLMNPWIRKMGFPVLTVAEEPGQIWVRQSRFLTTGDVTAEDDETTWWIPLGLQTGAQQSDVGVKALTVKEDTLRNIDETFYKFNVNQTGFYRTNYPPARLAKLGASKEKLSIEDKIGLIGDASALAISGEGTTAGLLSFLENFADETSFLVWSQIVASLGAVRSVFADNAKVAAGLRKFELALVSPAVTQLGWEFKKGEDYLTAQSRSLLIAVAGLCGHEAIIDEAKRQFILFTSGKDRKAIHPSLRSAVWRIAVTEGGPTAYAAMKKEFLNNTSVDGTEIALVALGRVQTPELATDYFNFLFSGRVPVQDVHSGVMAMAANPKTAMLQWDLIKSEWTLIRECTASNSVVFDRLLRLAMSKMASMEVAADLAAFFKDKDNRGYDRSLGILQDTITGSAKYKKRDEGVVQEWLEAHGYI